MKDRIRIGISSCLLGNPVRYDGGHKMDRYITDTLARYFEYIPVCPEVECGLGVPRESMRLVGDPKNPKLLTSKTGIDHTDRMRRWAQKRVKEMETENLCGFIFKKDSPSSGMERVKVYGEDGAPSRTGAGLFAGAFMANFPLIPVEEEGRLHDPKLRENFIERIFTMKRWRETLSKKRSAGNLVDFHTRHKLLVFSHSQHHHRQMGKLVAGAKDIPLEALYKSYESLLMDALKFKSTIKKNIDVLMHMMGYFKKVLSSDEKLELIEIIDQYRKEFLPLVVPITLINHYVRKYDQSYLKNQVILNPHPVDLKLRNHT